ncbi:MAG: segregation/condensation protein A [Lachnospiraceae bacterium]
MELNVKLQTFEGPLDLLLHLIDKNKVSIYDIPIAEITNQYMEYLTNLTQQDLNIMSEFLLMAATLLDIKSKMLLPAQVAEEEEQEDPRAELVEQLLEYKMYKCISFQLKDRQLDADRSFYKQETLPQEVQAYEQPIDMEALCKDITLTKLHTIFQSIMKKNVEKMDPVRASFGRIEKEEISMEETMSYLTTYAKEHKRFLFRRLFEHSFGKMEMIVMFLSVLELMKSGMLRVTQNELFDEIEIESQFRDSVEMEKSV